MYWFESKTNGFNELDSACLKKNHKDFFQFNHSFFFVPSLIFIMNSSNVIFISPILIRMKVLS